LLHRALLAIDLGLPVNLLVHLVFPLELRRALIYTGASKGALFYGMTGSTLDHFPREASVYNDAVDPVKIGHSVRVFEQLSVPHNREYEPAYVRAVKIAITGKAEEPKRNGSETAYADKSG
jgi:hypothetical protein